MQTKIDYTIYGPDGAEDTGSLESIEECVTYLVNWFDECALMPNSEACRSMNLLVPSGANRWLYAEKLRHNGETAVQVVETFMETVTVYSTVTFRNPEIQAARSVSRAWISDYLKNFSVSELIS